MAAKTKLLVAMIAAGSFSAAFATAMTDGTQIRTNASERLPLVQLVMPALQEIANRNKVILGCFTLISKPTVEITREVEVNREGLLMNSQANEYLSSNAGKLAGCAAAIAAPAEALAQTLRQKRPNRAEAIEMLKTQYLKTLASDYAVWQDRNQAAYNMPVLIAKGNNGYSKDYIAYNDVQLQRERTKPGENGDPIGSTFKVIIDGGENTLREKAGNIREVVFGGIYSWYTNPISINSLCAAPIAKPVATAKPAKQVKGKPAAKVEIVEAPVALPTVPCVETFSVKFDGNAVDIRKNGQRWFDSEFIGGAIYAIELSGEKSTGTTKKVDR